MAREQRALAAAVLGFFGTVWFLVALTGAAQALFGTLAFIYGMALFSLTAGYFWARWFARGLGWWGATIGVILLVTAGLETAFIIFTVGHLVVVLGLMGEGVTALYDGRTDWRERYGVDDKTAKQVGRTVTNLGSLLPTVCLYTLAPRYGEAGAALTITAVVLVLVGGWALLRMRTWGLLTVTAATVVLFIASFDLLGSSGVFGVFMNPGIAALVAVGFFVAIIGPYARPITRWLQG
jgi:hypothetical protein